MPAGPDALHPAEVVTSLSQCYSSLLDSMNAEIRIRWLQIVVRNDYYPDLHRVRRFLESQVRPLHLPHQPSGTGRADWPSRRAGRGGCGSRACAPGGEPRDTCLEGTSRVWGCSTPGPGPVGLWAPGLGTTVSASWSPVPRQCPWPRPSGDGPWGRPVEVG